LALRVFEADGVIGEPGLFGVGIKQMVHLIPLLPYRGMYTQKKHLPPYKHWSYPFHHRSYGSKLTINGSTLSINASKLSTSGS
jgi:hypothetical protein